MTILRRLCFIQIILFSFTAFCSEGIKNKLDNIISLLPPTTKAGIFIYNPLTEDTIYSLNTAMPMIPASNTKLFTTATALTLMGGDYQLFTKILTDDPVTEDGIINGNIFIKGFGNSLFTSEDLNGMADELVKAGIRKITGKIIGDATYFDDVYTRDDWITDEVANVRLPPISALVVNKNKKIIQRKRRGRLRYYMVNIDDPALNAASQLEKRLSEAGIEVASGSSRGAAPPDAKILSERGIILRELIKEINKESDNFLAECLFKTIGAVASGKQGNSFYSTQAILSFITDNNIYSDATAIVDGSGISRYDQVTVGAITDLLEYMYFNLKNYEDFYNSLSIAGVDGTLKNRLTGTFAENNFHGKTGTLNGVSSISGYLTCENGDDIIVSIFFEFTRGGANLHRDIQDQIILALCEQY